MRIVPVTTTQIKFRGDNPNLFKKRNPGREEVNNNNPKVEENKEQKEVKEDTFEEEDKKNEKVEKKKPKLVIKSYDCIGDGNIRW